MSDLIIEAQGVDYRYDGGGQALQGLDLTVSRGSRLAVLGTNGSGKTTLLLHLNGTMKPERGGIFLNGQAADYSRRGLLHWRQRVGLVFQSPDDQLFAASVYEDVSFGPLNLGLPETEVRRRVEEALTELDITHLRDRATHMLSFGQKKRVAIAGVLAMKPEVLILDEPTAGLDPHGMEQLLASLDLLHRAGATLVLTTHDVNLAYGWADEVAILRTGRVVIQGRTKEVFQDVRAQEALGEQPWILEIERRLREAEFIRKGEELPRTRRAFLESLSFRISRYREG